MKMNTCVHTIFITNDRAKPLYQIKLVKTDCCNCALRLKDAVFELFEFDKEACDYVAVRKNLRTDENGEIIVSNLPSGKYKLIERCAPPGYYNSRKCECVFDLNPYLVDGDSIEITLCNCRKICCFSE